jgi:hypothetical protein
MALNRNLVNWSRTIHIYLSICLLVILVFFSITGITLNHVEFYTADPDVTEKVISPLPAFPLDDQGQVANSPELADFLDNEFDVELDQATLTQDGDFLFVDYRTPGATVSIEIDQVLQEAIGETTDYGFVAMINDLHKARDTTILWKWLLDISSVLLVLFSLAGFVLLLPNKFRFKRVAGYSLAATLLLTLGYWMGNL